MSKDKRISDYLRILFQHRKAVREKLLSFGFKRTRNGYRYSTALLDGLLQMAVTVHPDGEVSAEVAEVSEKTGVGPKCAEKYSPLYDLDEYEEILDEINDACFEYDVFQGELTHKVMDYVAKKYHDPLEHLWKKFPENAIYRRKDTGKWYAALLTVERKKLKLSGEGTIEVIDLKMVPELIPTVIDHKKYFPGYHMNKKHWITICLDGSVPFQEIRRRIDESFALVGK